MIVVYRTVIEEHSKDSAEDPVTFAGMVAGYLEEVCRQFRNELDARVDDLSKERNKARKWAAKLRTDRDVLTERVRELKNALAQVEVDRSTAERDRNQARARLAAIERSILFRLQRRLGWVRSRVRA